jgi:hypothetical protein
MNLSILGVFACYFTALGGAEAAAALQRSKKMGGRFPHRPVWRNITRRRKTARRKELTSACAILKIIGPGLGWFITAAKLRPMTTRLAMAA